MFKQFSAKALNALKQRKFQKTNTSLHPHPVPKTYIAPTVDELIPKGRAVANLKKKETFAQQIIEKNKERIKKFAAELVHMVVHGSKSAYKDAKYMASVVSSKPKRSYTVEEIREIKRISIDLIKFVPFYAAIIIPAAEIALVPYLYLFPRAVPSYFVSETSMKEAKYKYIDNQTKAHDELKARLLSIMARVGYDTSNQDAESMKMFFEENKEALLPLLNAKKMDSETLKYASDFLMFEYVEGTYIFNKLYKTIVNLPRYGINLAMWIARNSYRAVWDHPFFNYNFKMNFLPFEGVKKGLIKSQFEKQLKSMKAQNFALLSSFFGGLNDNDMLDLARERGFNKNKEEAKKWLKEEWNPIAQKHLNDEIYLFWYSVILYDLH